MVSGKLGGLAHFLLPVGVVSAATMHKTVEELWYVVAGEGEMIVGPGKPTSISAGLSIIIPSMTRFQFRNTGSTSLEVLGVTMPNWPGKSEALGAPRYWDENGNVIDEPLEESH